MPTEEHGEDSVKAGDTLWRAVWLVTVADIVMSLDNVIAIAAAAETASMRVDMANALAIKTTLIVFGLATSVPLIIAGSALLMKVMEKFPILVWAGAALLGWVAGEIIVKDAAVVSYLGEEFVDKIHLWAAAVGAIFVVAVGWVDPAREAQGRAGASADHRSAGPGGVPAAGALRSAAARLKGERPCTRSSSWRQSVRPWSLCWRGGSVRSRSSTAAPIDPAPEILGPKEVHRHRL